MEINLNYKPINLFIDGIEVNILPTHRTIVDIARANGIGIPAPCYLQKRVHGCCNGCVVKINGEERYACTVKPVEGMRVEVKTPELINLRKEKLMLYKKALDEGVKLECNCGDGCDDGCGCGDGCC